MNYQEFIERKRHTTNQFGFDPVWMPEIAFDFQQEVITRALQKGRVGVFGDTGLGKTIIQLAIAENMIRRTNKKVLILTPLAVAFQFLAEAEKIGVSDIEHCKDGKHTKKIVISNYERLHYLNSDDFGCVILDESSILKNFDGKIKGAITAFIKKVPYRFLSTATPSPNDFIELGTSSEALGYMGYMDMLGKFFRNNQGSVDSSNRNIGEKYYLKPHAEGDFFAWVNSWSLMFKNPSDLGAFSNDMFVLPELVKNKHVVKNNSIIDVDGQSQLFNVIAKNFHEIRHEQRATINERCEQGAMLAEGKTSVYWCNLNDESALLNQLDSEAVEIKGAMSIDKKEDILIAFASGDIKRIITKAKMTGMGLNWQHCNHTVFFPTWSYEQYYQSIRRFWRFGQKREVTVDMVISDGQTRVITAIEQKTKKAQQLYENLVRAVNDPYIEVHKEFKNNAKLPSFL
jgi:hypothetical protein